MPGVLRAEDEGGIESVGRCWQMDKKVGMGDCAGSRATINISAGLSVLLPGRSVRKYAPSPDIGRVQRFGPGSNSTGSACEHERSCQQEFSNRRDSPRKVVRRQLHKDGGVGMREIGRRFNISAMRVSRICAAQPQPGLSTGCAETTQPRPERLPMDVPPLNARFTPEHIPCGNGDETQHP